MLRYIYGLIFLEHPLQVIKYNFPVFIALEEGESQGREGTESRRIGGPEAAWKGRNRVPGLLNTHQEPGKDD